MSIVFLLFYCSVCAFSGFTVGRIGHIYGGQIEGPDHWIYGVILFSPGLTMVNPVVFLLFAVGTGLIISDLKDFFNLKYWGPDNVEVLKFWHID